MDLSQDDGRRNAVKKDGNVYFFVPQGNQKVFVLNRSHGGNDGYAAGVLVVHKKSMFAHIFAYRYSAVVN